MVIEDIRNIKQGKEELRKFGVTVGIVFGVFGGFFWWRDKDYFSYFLILSAAFLLLGIARPILLKPIQKLWMTLALLMGWFVTRVILTILFFGVVTTVGLIGRLFNKKFLDLKFDRNAQSYWIPKKERKLGKDDYEKQF